MAPTFLDIHVASRVQPRLYRLALTGFILSMFGANILSVPVLHLDYSMRKANSVGDKIADWSSEDSCPRHHTRR